MQTHHTRENRKNIKVDLNFQFYVIVSFFVVSKDQKIEVKYMHQNITLHFYYIFELLLDIMI